MLSATTIAFESVPSLSTFKILSDGDVKLLIQHSAVKSCPLDPMPSCLVSKSDALLPVIISIINKSLQSGHFPESWKDAFFHYSRCLSST